MTEFHDAVEFADHFRKSFVNAKAGEGDDAQDDPFHDRLTEKAIDIYFNEATDRDLVDWKRARAVIEHENILVNHRLSWLLASQAGLFAAVGIIINRYGAGGFERSFGIILIPIYFISFIGILMCFNVYMNLKNANEQITRTTKWWYKRAFLSEDNRKPRDESELDRLQRIHRMRDAINARHHKHPHLHYSRKVEALFESRWWRRLARKMLVIAKIESIPWYIMATWTFMALGISLRSTDDYTEFRNWMIEYGPLAGVAFILGVMFCIVFVSLVFVVVSRDAEDGS